jgi:LacI family transcriptional regulator
MNGKTKGRQHPARPTMVQVAEMAEVSIFTVSAVVNGTSPVSDALRARVDAAIRQSGYRPSALARSLRTGQTHTVGLSIGDITNPFYTDVVARVQRDLHAAGYAVMLCCNERDVTLQDEQIALMRARQVDGLIVSPTGEDARLRRALEEVGAPVVLIDRVLPGFDCDAVVLDNRAAVGAAVAHLTGLGHRRIGLVAGILESFTGRERLAGYRDALARAGLPADPELVQVGSFRSAEAAVAAQRLMALAEPPTALIAANNLSAIGVMKGLSGLGFFCPDDVSLVAIDDFPWADVFEPKLTAVAQPVEAFGAEAARMLVERMRGTVKGKGRTVVLDGTLNVRTSSRRIGASRSAGLPGPAGAAGLPADGTDRDSAASAAGGKPGTSMA